MPDTEERYEGEGTCDRCGAPLSKDNATGICASHAYEDDPGEQGGYDKVVDSHELMTNKAMVGRRIAVGMRMLRYDG